MTDTDPGAGVGAATAATAGSPASISDDGTTAMITPRRKMMHGGSTAYLNKGLLFTKLCDRCRSITDGTQLATEIF